jgi:hypothetical protein
VAAFDLSTQSRNVRFQGLLQGCAGGVFTVCIASPVNAWVLLVEILR